jgi:hypothetical protein
MRRYARVKCFLVELARKTSRGIVVEDKCRVEAWLLVVLNLGNLFFHKSESRVMNFSLQSQGGKVVFVFRTLAAVCRFVAVHLVSLWQESQASWNDFGTLHSGAYMPRDTFALESIQVEVGLVQNAGSRVRIASGLVPNAFARVRIASGLVPNAFARYRIASQGLPHKVLPCLSYWWLGERGESTEAIQVVFPFLAHLKPCMCRILATLKAVLNPYIETLRPSTPDPSLDMLVIVGPTKRCGRVGQVQGRISSYCGHLRMTSNKSTVLL